MIKLFNILFNFFSLRQYGGSYPMGNDKKGDDDKVYADESSKTGFTTESRHGDRRDSTPEEVEDTIKEYDKNDRQGGNKGGSIGK